MVNWMQKKTKVLHIRLEISQFEKLVKLRGPRKWKEWLLTLPEQFQILSERIEFFNAKLELAKKSIDELKEENKKLRLKLEG